MGFTTLHVVDLDAALSLGHNRPAILEIAAATGASLQVGGGVRDEANLEDLLALGASRVIVGTRALDDPAWLEAVATRHPDRILVAADVRHGSVLRKGWTESTGTPVEEALDRLQPLPLAGILCTDVAREGRMNGIDLPAASAIIARSPHPAWISGGITTLDELRSLDRAGAAGAVLGMALYTGVLSAANVAKEFGA
jgi:phosphoribosylformimino-5-aminoimidazole carboxamide ribotide isomerase